MSIQQLFEDSAPKFTYTTETEILIKNNSSHSIPKKCSKINVEIFIASDEVA